MSRKPEERGRPIENKLPPRIDASPEQIADAFFRFPVDRELAHPEYHCGQCSEAVTYPAVLDRSGRCPKCVKALD